MIPPSPSPGSVRLDRDALMAAKRSRGLSAGALAAAAGVSRKAVTRALYGDLRAGPLVLRRLAGALGVPAESLRSKSEVHIEEAP